MPTTANTGNSSAAAMCSRHGELHLQLPALLLCRSTRCRRCYLLEPSRGLDSRIDVSFSQMLPLQRRIPRTALLIVTAATFFLLLTLPTPPDHIVFVLVSVNRPAGPSRDAQMRRPDRSIEDSSHISERRRVLKAEQLYLAQARDGFSVHSLTR